MAILVIGPYLVGDPIYDDSATPDETKAVDAAVSDVLWSMESNFASFLENPTMLEFEPYTLPERKPLTPSYNYLQNVESVVYITSEDQSGQQYYGTGSVISSDGVIVSNYHNVDDAVKVAVSTYGGEHYPVSDVLAFDPIKDVVFLKIDVEGLRPMPIGDDSEVAVGEQTVVIGHPEGFLNSISLGVLSGRRSYHENGEGVQLQITNPISGGNSGGAILNEYGELIGIPTATIEYVDNSVQVQNINLAVPITGALSVLK